ncbi:hypothetical protein [Dactylosporangium sp. NPDC051541]|uniref:hypothetical protein n=1 Tax=Dactylosporangium sp. NPDC051541 TaxID=3363977 RepID=UPI0037B82E0F
MTPERLSSLAAYAGDRIHPSGASGPYPFGLDVPIHVRNVIYVVCAWSGQILYVGSTTVGVRIRFAQHLVDSPKTLDWAPVYAIPLSNRTSVRDVRRIEGRVGLAAAPERSRALPRLANGR